MYYALLDLQNGGYMHTGCNTTSRKELLDHLKDYIGDDLDDETDINTLTLTDICEMWEFEIVTSDKKFREEW